MALQPGVLRRLAEAAVKPYFDETLEKRARAASLDWRTQAQARLKAGPGYDTACAMLQASHDKLVAMIETYRREQREAGRQLLNIAGEVRAPEPIIDYDAQPRPLFTTDDDFVEATERLKAAKAWEPLDGESDVLDDLLAGDEGWLGEDEGEDGDEEDDDPGNDDDEEPDPPPPSRPRLRRPR